MNISRNAEISCNSFSYLYNQLYLFGNLIAVGKMSREKGHSLKPFSLLGLWSIFLFVVLIVMFGCATQKNGAHKDSSNENANDATDEERSKSEKIKRLKSQLVASKIECQQEGLRVKIYPLVDDDLAMLLAGVNTTTSGMLPVHITFENSKDVPVKINISDARMSANKKKYATLTIDAAIKKALRRDPAAIIAIPFIFGVMIVTSYNTATNMNIEDYYWQNAFKPTLVNKKSVASGLVFFEMPEDDSVEGDLSYFIPVTNLSTNETSIFSCSKVKKDFDALTE